MQKIVDMSGKPVRVSLSRAAERALAGHEVKVRCIWNCISVAGFA